MCIHFLPLYATKNVHMPQASKQNCGALSSSVVNFLPNCSQHDIWTNVVKTIPVKAISDHLRLRAIHQCTHFPVMMAWKEWKFSHFLDGPCTVHCLLDLNIWSTSFTKLSMVILARSHIILHRFLTLVEMLVPVQHTCQWKCNMFSVHYLYTTMHFMNSPRLLAGQPTTSTY